MIKSTFYNLPDSKRERVIRAIMQEFSSAESDKVSINRIIKRANISRGSFYQYFDDKVDLVEVLIKSLVDLALEETFRAISVSNGDIFSTYSKLLDIIAGFSRDEEQRSILCNIVKNMRVSDSLISEYMVNRFKGCDEFTAFTSSYSRDNLRFPEDEDVIALQQILNGIIRSAVFKIYAEDESIESVKREFARKLDIIRQGAFK